MDMKIIIKGIILVVGIIVVYSLGLRNKNRDETKVEGIYMVIDDEVINQNDPMRVIEPLWWNCNIYDGEDMYYSTLEEFNKEQIYVFGIMWYEAEVNNGGHDQFYFNSTGVVWEEAVEGFKELGLNEYLNIISESVFRMEAYPIKDRYSRQEQMERLEVDFEDLDMRFYNSEVNLNNALQNYIKSNKEKFYFEGIVQKPEN